MRLEMGIGTLVIISGVSFVLGKKYGELKMSNEFFTKVSEILVNKVVEDDEKENSEAKGE